MAIAPFMRGNTKKKLKVYVATLYEINMVLEVQDLQEKTLTQHIRKEYHHMMPLFDTVIAE
jgi:hypothetical protein